MSGPPAPTLPALAVALAFEVSLGCAPVDGQDAAASATLSGVVVDVASNRPISGARVVLPGTSVRTETDAEGGFEILGFPMGTHVVSASRFGYLDVTHVISMDEDGSIVRIAMEPAPFNLEGMTVLVEDTGELAGRVVEAGTGEPVPGVVVWLPAVEEGVPADSLGRFTFSEIPYGPQVIQVRRAGYGGRIVPVAFQPWSDPFEIVMEPDQGLLAALPAVSRRLRGRRNAFQGIVTVHDTERLTRSGVEDVRDYLFKHTLTRVVPCTGMARSFWCVEVNGRPVEPRVCIDGWIEWGGLDLLQRMGPNQLHLLEVYGTSGMIIRAYTHDYIEGLARGAGDVAPDEPTPQREGVEGLGWASGRTDAEVALGPRC